MKPQIDLALDVLLLSLVVFMMGMASPIILHELFRGEIATLGMMVIWIWYAICGFYIFFLVRDMRKDLLKIAGRAR